MPITEAEIINAIAVVQYALREYYISESCTPETYEPECISCQARVASEFIGWFSADLLEDVNDSRS